MCCLLIVNNRCKKLRITRIPSLLLFTIFFVCLRQSEATHVGQEVFHSPNDRYDVRNRGSTEGREDRALDDNDDDNDGIDDFEHGKYTVLTGDVSNTFSNKRTFACPIVKPALHTGDTTSTISPEDIDIVSALGDSMASGRGLWSPTDVDFRGAAFPIGGDANIDGLVTIPNILLEFNERLEGVSHGMGTREQLPEYQFNTAEKEATTLDMPAQARELVSRLHNYVTVPVLKKKWVLVTIAIGTEELCSTCSSPDHSSLRRTMGTLRKGIPKALVVLLGPVHVASSYSMNSNLLRPRCKCLQDKTKKQYIALIKEWITIFDKVQDEFNHLNYTHFTVLSIPQLTIHSRDPKSLFIDDKPFLNRKGHTYAAKYLWNRLITGPSYNFTAAHFSQDSYFCPSVGCPYFRTVQNFERCTITTEYEYNQKIMASTVPTVTARPSRRQIIQRRLGGIIAITVSLCFLSVLTLGTVFYCRGLKKTKGRFENLGGV